MPPTLPKPAPRTRVRRSEEQLIADLRAKIDHLKARAASKAAKKDPTVRHVHKAVRAIDAAMAATGDHALRTALQEAHATLSACLQLGGDAVPTAARSNGSADLGAVLAFVQKNPGQRGEHIAAALGTDTKVLRGSMKRLIEDRKIETKGERRGMRYWAAK